MHVQSIDNIEGVNEHNQQEDEHFKERTEMMNHMDDEFKLIKEFSEDNVNICASNDDFEELKGFNVSASGTDSDTGKIVNVKCGTKRKIK